MSAPPQVVLGFVCEGDFKLVAKAIRDRVTNIKRQREKLRRVAEEQRRSRRRKDEEEQQQQQQQQLLQAAPLEEERSLERESPGPPCRTPTSCQTSPVAGGSADSGLAAGLAAAAAAEAEEPEVDQHFHIRHNSCSSANCEPRMILPMMHLTPLT